MFNSDPVARKSELVDTFYKNLSTLSSGSAKVFNARIPGSAFFTMVKAFAAMVSDAWDILVSVAIGYDPVNSTGDAAVQSLAFFERERNVATACVQTFTIFRTDATEARVVPAGATIQTPISPSGLVVSYKLLEGFTIPAGVFFYSASFKAVSVGLVTTITSPIGMEAVSGLSSLYVAAGYWSGGNDPFGGVAPTSMAAWTIAKSGSFRMVYAVQGIDIEPIDDYRARCFARWDEQSTGSTAKAYESWATSYVSPEGDTPVAIAKVTNNQVFHDLTTYGFPPGQRYPAIDGQEYIMGTEVAIALRAGVAPDRSLLLAIGASMLDKIPQNDVLWLRAPNAVQMSADAVHVIYKGPASLLTTISAVVRSFFFYDPAYPDNASYMGSEIDKADIIYAVKSVDPRVDNVKVVFTIPGKTNADGDIELAEFDQLVLAVGVSAANAVQVEVV